MFRRGAALAQQTMSIDFKIIGQSAMLTTPTNCFIFNPCEGIQRDLLHAKLKLQNVSHVFLSHRDNSSGLFGLLMTNSVSGNHTSIYACNMIDYVQGMSIFTERLPHATVHDFVRSDLEKTIMAKPDIKDFSYGNQPQIEDDGLGLKINRELSFYEDNLNKVFPMFVKKSTLKKKKPNNTLNANMDSTVVSYLIHLPSFRGKIDVKKLEKYAIPKQDIKKITRNKEMVLDGKLITLAMISSKPRVGRVVFILNCPSAEYIEDLKSHPYIELYATNSKKQDILVAHFTTKEIFNSPSYQSILTALPTATHQLSDTSIVSGLPFYQQRIDSLSSISKYFPRATGLSWENSFIDFTMYPEFTKTIRSYDVIEARESTLPISIDVPVLSTYGTGSAIPQVTQNVTGHCLSYHGKRYLFDPGEDTLRSILFSTRNAKCSDKENDAKERAYWNSLKFIYVSHGHADHHSGLQSILKRWSEFTPQGKLHLLVTSKLFHWLQELSKLLEYIDFSRINIHITSWYTPLEYRNDPRLKTFQFDRMNTNMMNKMLTDLDIQFETIPVNHPGQANACKLKLDGFTFVYSGDTTYFPNLSNFASNCDLLVHECTFEDYDRNNARTKLHSTLSDALRVFKESNAKRMVLSHFSQKFQQRHPDTILDACRNSNFKVIPAFDGLQIPITDTDFKCFGSQLDALTNDTVQSRQQSAKQPTLIQQKL